MLRFNRQVRKARPNLWVVAPLTFWIVCGFILFNFAIAYTIHLVGGYSGLVIINKVLTPDFWASVFIFLGLLPAFGIAVNSWSLVKKAMILGLFVKSLFMYALVIETSRFGFAAVGSSLVLWAFIMHIQAGVVIHFLPNGHTLRDSYDRQ